MTVALPHYAKIKDRYCLAYFGASSEYIYQLLALRPNIEKELPGLEVYIACQDVLFPRIQDHDRVISRQQLQDNIKHLAYVREVKCNLVDHPIEQLMLESNIPLKISTPTRVRYKRCLVCPIGYGSTKSLTPQQQNQACDYAAAKGYDVSVAEDIPLESVGCVIGVECSMLFDAAMQGIKTMLIPTGLGTSLYQKMFDGEILKI